MECEKVKSEYPEYKFEECCPSCHEDEDMGHGHDLWFIDPKGEDRHTCCAIGRGLDDLSNSSKL